MYPLPDRGYTKTSWVRLAPASYASAYRMLAAILLLQLLTLSFSIAEVLR